MMILKGSDAEHHVCTKGQNVKMVFRARYLVVNHVEMAQASVG